MKKIEYNKNIFENELDARHAMFFDDLDIEWEYKPFIVDYSEGKYIPTFFLKEIKTFFEVVNDDVIRKNKSIKAIQELVIDGEEVLLVVSDGVDIQLYFYGQGGRKYSEYDSCREEEIDKDPHIAKCTMCGCVHFYNSDYAWICPNCDVSSEDAIYGGSYDYELPELPLPTNFYKSKAWRELRVEALTRQGGKCCLCGRTPKDDIILHVDHIKPRSLYPELELDLSNLQILCEDCNMGKSNKYEEDWRKS